MMIRLSRESADALSLVEELETWGVAPTMVRGSKQVAAANGVLPQPKKQARARRHGFKTDTEKSKVIKANLKAKVAKEAASQVHDAEPSAYGRNEAGRALIQAKLRHIYKINDIVFKHKPLWNTDGFCLMAYAPAQTVKWQEALELAPECLETMHLGPFCSKAFQNP